MALYSYEAFSRDGKKVTGTLDAPSITQLKETLIRQGLYPISIVSARSEAKQPFWQRLFSRKVSVKEKILFTKQFAVLLKAGVPLLEALELLAEQFQGSLRSMIVSIKDDVKEGTSLADALAKYPKTFDVIYVQLVRAGEASGKLEVILERLTNFLERQAEVASKIKSALQYPIIQLVISALVVIGLLTGVVPRLKSVFEGQKQLPLSTRILLSISDFLLNHYLVFIVLTAIPVLLFLYWKATPAGQLIIDKIKLKLPLIKYFAKTNAVVQFCYTFGILLEGGVNLAEALDIVTKIIDNKILANALNQAKENIIRQGKIAEYLKQTDIFPPIAIYLIKTGEQSGQLDSMLLTVARNYEIELTELVDSLTGLISPIMTVVMALIVGFIVLAIAGPIMNAGQNFLQ